eukprot:366540-Chlamydomonas_euryale.AAC.11
MPRQRDARPASFAMHMLCMHNTWHMAHGGAIWGEYSSTCQAATASVHGPCRVTRYPRWVSKRQRGGWHVHACGMRQALLADKQLDCECP